MKTVLIVQARMTSTRLPGKVLREVLGRPLLSYQLERLRRIKEADEIVIATTVNREDQPIVDLCHKESVACFRGSELDVLERYYLAAREHDADIVVRITSDCPLIDPTVSGAAIGFLQTHFNEYDYVNVAGYPRGLDTEVFSFKTLEEAFREATEKPEREHVTPFIYRTRSDKYRLHTVENLLPIPPHRWTVDTPEDFELITKILTALYPMQKEFTWLDVLGLFTVHPAWYDINAHIEQKQYGK